MKIFVIKDDILIGFLDEKNEVKFEYFDNINPINYLPGLDKLSNYNKDLFPIFENLLPENEQLQLIITKYKIKLDILPIDKSRGF